jgi:hypothetical protein
MTVRGSQTLLAVALGVAAALILIAGVGLLVLPQRSHIHKINGEVSAEQAQLTTAQAAAASPASSPVKVNAADLFRLSEAMPDTDRMPQILVDLSALARASSVELTSVKPSTEVPLTGYTALPLVIGVTGKYKAVTQFTRRLHDAVRTPSSGRLLVSGRLFIVNQIQLSSSDGRTVSAVINLDAFDYVPVVPVAPGTSTTPTSTTPGGST